MLRTWSWRRRISRRTMSRSSRPSCSRDSKFPRFTYLRNSSSVSPVCSIDTLGMGSAQLISRALPQTLEHYDKLNGNLKNIGEL